MFRLLIVEDERTTREALRETFDWAAWGFLEVRDAADGREALTACAAFRPDLVVTDIRMPGMSGLELADRLREQLPCCRVIILSAYQNPEYVHRAFRSRAVDYLLKPVKQSMLTEAVIRAVEHLLAGDVVDSGRAPGARQGGLNGIRQRIMKRILARGPRAAELARTYEGLFLGEPRSEGAPVKMRYALYLLRKAGPLAGRNEADFDELENQLQVLGESSEVIGGGFLMPVRTRPLEIACVAGFVSSHGFSQASCEKVADEMERAVSELWGGGARILRAGWTERLPELGDRYAQVAVLGGSSLGPGDGGRLSSHEESLARRIQAAVEEGFLDERLSVKRIAAVVGRTSAYLCMVFKKAYGMTINDYVNLVRIAEAKRLLDESLLKLYDVAYEVGYSSENYFSKVFRKYEGRSPSEYRERTR